MTSTLTLLNLASILNLSQLAEVGDIYCPYLDMSIWNLFRKICYKFNSFHNYDLLLIK